MFLYLKFHNLNWNIYCKVSYRELFDQFEMKSGLKRCSLSSILFNLLLENIIRNTETNHVMDRMGKLSFWLIRMTL